MYLLFDRRSDVKRAHDGAHIFGLTNGSQSCHASTNHEDFSWGDLAGSGDLAGEKSTEMVGSFDDCSVA